MAAAKLDSGQAGFSLVELMVGMVLGLMLIAGAASIYLATKRSYVEVEQVAALAENARFAEQIVAESLRHIGFMGELSANRIDVHPDLTAAALANDCNAQPEAAAYNLRRMGFAATVDGNGDALGCIDDGVEGTDVLVIKRASTQPYSAGPRVTDPNDPPANLATIDTPHELEAGRTYVMTNNITGLLFDGSNPPSITTGGEVPGGTAWEYQYEVFYIRREDPDPDKPTMLSRRALLYNETTDTMEWVTENLAEGVEDLQLLFGYDSDGDGEVDTYKDPSLIGGNWPGVESVEVFMLVRSATKDVQYTDEKTYQLGDKTVDPSNDYFRRLLSHTSVSLRNLKFTIRGGA